VDWARIFAIPTVVSLHVLSPAAFAISKLSPMAWGFVDLVDSASRWGVPAFIMVSGALLLDPSYRIGDPGAYLIRRMRRIVIPLVIWSLVFWWFQVNVRDQNVPPELFARRFIEGEPYYHLYFLYIVAGLSIVTPLLRPFVREASFRVLGLATGLALAWAIVERILAEFGLARPTNGIEIFSKYIGYFLAGAWIRQMAPSRSIGVLAIAVATIGTLFTALATWYLAVELDGAHRAYPYAYTSAFTVVTSIAIVIAIRMFSTWKPRWLTALAGLTFGVYLVHPLTLPSLAEFSSVLSRDSWLPFAYAMQLSVAIAVSAAVTWVFRKVPVVRGLF
jgi:surface polysaccharide O-acyltransferase-like enzyme